MLEKRQRLIAMARRWDESAGKVPKALVLKKQIDLEGLLRWAYFDELPKIEIRRAKPLPEFKEGWASLANFGDYTERRSCNLWGGFRRFDRWGEPHEDALAVAKAVERLDTQIFDLPEEFNPFSEFPDCGQEFRAQIMAQVKVSSRKGQLKLRFKPSALVFNYTILGGAPAWQLQAAGAASLSELPKEQVLAIGLARAEYEIWHMSLGMIALSLAAKLVKHELLPALPPARPWEAAAGKKDRILPVLNGSLEDQANALEQPPKGCF